MSSTTFKKIAERRKKTSAAILQRMTLGEKLRLLNGRGLWRTSANYRLDIPEVVMTDGSYGVRFSPSQIVGGEGQNSDLATFLDIVAQNSGQGHETSSQTEPATCFPTGSCIANSWNRDLVREVGEAIGRECRNFGVDMLLGPGINIRRTPLGGRAYEYVSEDPYLSGELGAAMIQGIQRMGVGACLKHFACNNSEIERTSMDSRVDERALREIYLAGFERAIRKGKPHAVMSSYNRVNGEQAAESEWLLTRLLREEWRYQGLVISDWHGIKDRPASLRAGNDLDMPESLHRQESLARAFEAGLIDEEVIDRSCVRMLDFITKVTEWRRTSHEEEKIDFADHHRLAYRAASESLVLVHNKGILPLNPDQKTRIAIIGAAATVPVIQGSGSATIRPTAVDIPLDELRKRLPKAEIEWHAGPSDDADENGLSKALALAARCDTTIVFANSLVAADGEGADRQDLFLAPGQDRLITELGVSAVRTIVVTANPDAVAMEWLDRVDAVLVGFFAGQAFGSACADILVGSANPSGKLAATFPHRIEDTPGFLTYPGEGGIHRYSEGIFVGYRYYDARMVKPLFPFGFGLSYTSFAYSNIEAQAVETEGESGVEISFDVRNSGPLAGAETAQIYASFPKSPIRRAPRALVEFVKVSLAPGQSSRLSVTVPQRDLRFYDVAHDDWAFEGGLVDFQVGSSSRDLRLSAQIDLPASHYAPPDLSLDSPPIRYLEEPLARRHLEGFLTERWKLSPIQLARLCDMLRPSFFSLGLTLNWYVEDSVSDSEITALIAIIIAERAAMR